MATLLLRPEILALVLSVAGAGGTPGQQLLVLSPGGIVEFRNATISLSDFTVGKSGNEFSYAGRTYPYGGKAFWEAESRNRKKVDVLNRIAVAGGKLLLDGGELRLGVPVERVYQAVAWGDVIACLALVPHANKDLFEPNQAHALLILSPTEKRGRFLLLNLVGKVDYRLLLVDPLESRE